MNQNFRTGFTYLFRDPRWISKVGIGSALTLASLVIPLVPLFFLAGYCLRISRRIILGDGEAALPEWGDWSNLFKEGFRFSEAGLLYALPGLLLFTAGYFLVGYPLVVRSFASLLSGVMQSMTAEGQAWINTGLWLMGIATLLSLVGGLASMPAAMHMVARDSVRAVLRVREWWTIFSAAPGAFIGPFLAITACLLILVTVFTVLTASLVLCLPGAVFFSVGGTVLPLIASALFASAYRAGVAKSQGE